MVDNKKINLIEKKIDDLNLKLLNSKILELSEIISNWKKLLFRNFISGIFKGIGIGIGISVVTAILIIIMRRIISLNIPILSNYISDIVEIVELNK